MANNNYYGFQHGSGHYSTGLGSSSGSTSYLGSYGNSQSIYGSNQSTATSRIPGYQDVQFSSYGGRTQGMSSAAYEDHDLYYSTQIDPVAYTLSPGAASSTSRYQSQVDSGTGGSGMIGSGHSSNSIGGRSAQSIDWHLPGGSAASDRSTTSASHIVDAAVGINQSAYSILRNAGHTSIPAAAAALSASTNTVGQQMSASYTAGAQYSRSYRKPIVGAVDASTGMGRGTGGSGNWAARKPFYSSGPRLPPKPSQLHYCEICKISCAGAQTYAEHLEGKNHKKKESMSKNVSTVAASASRQARQFYCELCDVACTCNDTYAAHLRGAKHQKVLTLHQKLGKPIPEQPKPDDVQFSADGRPGTSAVTKRLVGSKIAFVGGTVLRTTDSGLSEESTLEPGLDDLDDESMHASADGASEEVQPVGLEYIEEGCNDAGTAASYYCKLCNCHFTDPQAKLMHSKGRRHRQNYKDKVDPTLVVDTKVAKMTPYARRLQMEKLKRHVVQGDHWHKRRLEEVYRQEVEELRYEQEVLRYQLTMANSCGPMFSAMAPAFGFGGNGMPYLSDPANDQLVTTKHEAVYPTAADLQAVQKMVSSCERALKLVSDAIASKSTDMEEPEKIQELQLKIDTDNANGSDESTKATLTDAAEACVKPPPPDAVRQLKGVMRIGLLAKGLLLHEELDLHLIVLCNDPPTRSLIHSIYQILPVHLANVMADHDDEPYGVAMTANNNSILVTQQKEPKVNCTISFTSHAVKDTSSIETGDDAVDRHTCLELLAALRHTKWFQATISRSSVGLAVVRIMRDLCQRIPTWQPLGQWPLELIVEKCLSSANAPMSMAILLRTVFECISVGLFLPGGPGLVDPCEKEVIDAVGFLDPQQRMDITTSAQHALRLIAFGQLHRVLGLDSTTSVASTSASQKRSSDSSDAATADGCGLQPT